MKSSFSIKPKTQQIVKALIALIYCTLPLRALADEPILQVRTYKVQIEKRSETRRVYLFKAYDGEASKQNTVILLRTLDSGQNVMAFRVIRNYEDDLFAVTRVRSYSGFPVLEVSENYLALEKVGETYLPTDSEKRQDEAELNQLEKGLELEVLEYDPELDAGTSPSAEAIEESLRDIVIDETARYDSLKNWVSFQFAMLKNFALDAGQKSYYSGMGFRYGRTIGESLFFNDEDAQDSLVVELGVFYYKIVPFDPALFDSYAIMPLLGTLRYNVNFTKSFALYVHLGLLSNSVISFNNSTEENKALLSSLLPAFGVGSYIELGPKWDMRIDLGLEMIGLGLILRF